MFLKGCVIVVVMNWDDVAHVVKRARLWRDLTQEEAAASAGVGITTWQQLEAADAGRSARTLSRVERWMDVPPDTLRAIAEGGIDAEDVLAQWRRSEQRKLELSDLRGADRDHIHGWQVGAAVERELTELVVNRMRELGLSTRELVTVSRVPKPKILEILQGRWPVLSETGLASLSVALELGPAGLIDAIDEIAGVHEEQTRGAKAATEVDLDADAGYWQQQLEAEISKLIEQGDLDETDREPLMAAQFSADDTVVRPRALIEMLPLIVQIKKNRGSTT